MTFDRVRSPENHQIGPIFNLAQSTGGFAYLLKCHDQWRMAERSRGIKSGANPLAKRNGRTLPLSAAARQAIDQGSSGGSEEFCRAGHSRIERGRLTFDHGNGRPATFLTEKPRFGKPASARTFADPIVFDGNAQIVANAATNSTCHAFVNSLVQLPLPFTAKWT